jgi:hypothetical protein
MDPGAHVPTGRPGIEASAQSPVGVRIPTWCCGSNVHSLCPGKRAVERRASTWRDEEAAQSAESLHLAGALRVRGGMLPADEVAWRMRPHYDQPISQLARWIVTRAIVVVPSGSFTFVPMFQFDPTRMTLRVEVSAALAELVPVFDDLEVAGWFVEPNRWLGGLAPVESLGQGSVALLQAARTDRYIATG